MKIISWNCNCKFREKFQAIVKYEADVYVIQECETPAACNHQLYQEFAQNYVWIGENPHKGLGIFAREHIELTKNDWNTGGLRYFLSVKLNRKIDLIGVWACKPYIKQYYAYQNMNLAHYGRHTIVIGDFNSNKIWDNGHTTTGYSAVVRELQAIGLESAYHDCYRELQGEESQHTFYMHRHADKGYHIDHCFVNKEILNNYPILSDGHWLELSDHIPVLLEISA